MNNRSIEPVDRFFAAFGKGDMEGLIATMHPDVKIEVEGPATVPHYRTYSGTEGARRFIQDLGSNLRTQRFEVQTLLGAENVVMAAGVFTHIVVATGKVFQSSWALRCEIKDDRIAHYRFYENTAAALEAYSGS